MNYYELKEPQKWKAGAIGDKPIYFRCADCDTESEIKGFVASGPAFKEIAVMGEDAAHRLALFCATCFRRRIQAKGLGMATR